MTFMERTAVEFHKLGVVYLVDGAGNIHELGLEAYASMTADALRGCDLFLTRMLAESCASRKRRRS